MKALVIAPQPFYTPRGTPFSVYYRTLVMAENGVEVDLLTYGQGEDVDIPGVRIIRIPRFPRLGPIKTGPSSLKIFLDSVLILQTIGHLIRNRYDFVHAHEEAVFFCRYLKPIFGFKLVYDMHSSLPQQLTNFNFTESKVLIGLCKWLEDGALARSEAVLTICPELADYALSRAPIEDRHILIENSIFEPIKLASPKAGKATEDQPAALPQDRPIVYYAGTFESYQGIDIVIEAFALLHQRCPDAFLLMAGGSPAQVERYHRLAMDLGLEGHCMFTGMIPKALAQHYQAGASVLLSPRIEGMNTPLKVYEQLAAGIPLVATRIPSHTQVLSDEVCFLAAPEPKEMAEAMLAALTDHDRIEAVVTAAKALYEKKYSRPVYERKIRQMLEMLR
ncbi:MAG: glycosyltransferase family 4 protein [Pseudomonadota bacterium]